MFPRQLITPRASIGLPPMAQNNIGDGVMLVVGILIVGLLTAYLAPIFLDELATVDTSSWGAAEAALFGILGLLFILAIVLFVVQWAVNAADMS